MNSIIVDVKTPASSSSSFRRMPLWLTSVPGGWKLLHRGVGWMVVGGGDGDFRCEWP